MGVLDRMRQWFGGWQGRMLPDVPAPTDYLGNLEIRRADATRAVREATLSGVGTVLDNDDHLYRAQGGGQSIYTRDFTEVAHDKMLKVCWFLFETNPFAKRLITLMTDLVVGEGVQASAKDPAINGVIEQTWNHPINQFTKRMRSFFLASALNGELILTAARNPVSGIPQFGYIDPLQILTVLKNEENPLIDEYVVLKPINGQSEGYRLKIVQENAFGVLEGDVFYFPFNSHPNAKRGRPDLAALADWLDLYDQYQFSEIDRAKQLSAFVYDLTVEGESSEDALRKRANELKKVKPGGAYVHNEKQTLQAITPSLNGEDRSVVGQQLATHIAGSAGYPLSWLGWIDSNKATIEGQNDILLKTPTARQKEFAGHLQFLLRYAVEGARAANPVLFRQLTAGTDIVVKMPEIASKDIARIGTVLASIASAVDVAVNNGTMSREAGMQTMLAALRHMGIDLDEEAIRQQIEGEMQAKQELDDQRAAALAKATATMVLPPKAPRDRELVA